MKKEFIPYEQALVLRELGFNEECLGYFDEWINYNKEVKQIFRIGTVKGFFEDIIPAPLYQQAFRWFREKYGLFYDILQYIDKDWKYTTYSDNVDDFLQSGFYNTYEEAELACLKELIEMVKEKK
jgi:hypothetical protein